MNLKYGLRRVSIFLLQDSDRQLESWTGVATFAVAERQVAAEVPAAVVAGGAGLAASGVEVLGRIRGADLACLRSAGSELVAVGACESLARAVVRVTERVTKCARIRGCRTIRFLIVANPARRHFAAGV